jgi:hypothetical protein
MNQAQWVTRMARFAATDLEADWVINSDADEFWWPRGGSLKEVLSTVPERYGVVRGFWRHFLPRPQDGRDFAERMTVRLCSPAHPGNKTTIFHAHQKVAHRADPFVDIERGNHDAVGAGLDPLRGWHPIEVLHFSLRSIEQLGKKGRAGWMRSPPDVRVEHQIRLAAALRDQRLQEFLDARIISDDDLEPGLAAGVIAIDTRLRDALRMLRGSDGEYRLPVVARPLGFPIPEVTESTLYAAEAATLVEIDGIVRAEQRVQVLEDRLAALERRTVGMLGSALAARASRLTSRHKLARR